MRTLAKTLEYIAIAAMTLGLTYYGLTPVAHSISDSLNESAQMIEHPETVAR